MYRRCTEVQSLKTIDVKYMNKRLIKKFFKNNFLFFIFILFIFISRTYKIYTVMYNATLGHNKKKKKKKKKKKAVEQYHHSVHTDFKISLISCKENPFF